MFDFETLPKEFLSVRLGAMLEKKAKMSQRYQMYNREEQQHFESLVETLSEEQTEQMETYRNAVIDREIQELYFAYMTGLRDGVRINDLLDEA